MQDEMKAGGGLDSLVCLKVMNYGQDQYLRLQGLLQQADWVQENKNWGDFIANGNALKQPSQYIYHIQIRSSVQG